MACSWRFVARGVVEEAKRYLQHGREALDLKTIVAFSCGDNLGLHRVLEKIDMWFVGRKDRGTRNSDQAAQGYQAGSPAAALLDLPEQCDQISVFQVLRAQCGHGRGVVFSAGTELSPRLGDIVGGGF